MTDFRTSEEAVLYMTECTLATVEWLSLKNKVKRGEFKRQISIAQNGVSFIKKRGIKPYGRIVDVMLDHDGDVASWVKTQKLR